MSNSPGARRPRQAPARLALVERQEHLAGKAKSPLAVAPLLDLAPNWRVFLKEGLTEEDADRIRRAERTGRPLGSDAFIKRLEKKTGRVLKKRKPGPKPKRTD